MPAGFCTVMCRRAKKELAQAVTRAKPVQLPLWTPHSPAAPVLPTSSIKLEIRGEIIDKMFESLVYGYVSYKQRNLDYQGGNTNEH